METTQNFRNTQELSFHSMGRNISAICGFSETSNTRWKLPKFKELHEDLSFNSMGLSVERWFPINFHWMFEHNINNFFPQVVLAWRYCLQLNEEQLILIRCEPKSFSQLLACQELLPPNMHRINLIEINQPLTKSHIEIEDNPKSRDRFRKIAQLYFRGEFVPCGFPLFMRIQCQ